MKIFWGAFSPPEQQLAFLKLLRQHRRRVWMNDCFRLVSQQPSRVEVCGFFPRVYTLSLSKPLCSAKWSRLVVVCDVRRCKPSVCVSAKVTCFCLFFPNSFAPAVAAAAAAAAAHLAKVTLRCFIFHPELDMWSSKNTRPPLIFLVSPSSRLACPLSQGQMCWTAALVRCYGVGGAVLQLLIHIQLY